MALIITDETIRTVLDVPFVSRAVEDGFRQQAAGGVLPPMRMDVPLGRGWLRVMAVGVPNWDVYGVKVMNLTPDVGLRYAFALYQQSTGRLLALMDAKTITAMRTAATAALAARCLTADDIDTLAVIGTGNEARRLLEAMNYVRPVDEVRVYSRGESNRQRFIDDAADRYPARFTSCSSAEAAVDGVRLVVMATKSSSAVLALADVAPDCHVSSIGASRQDQAEVAPDLLAAAELLVCDSVQHVFAEAGDVRAAVDQGVLTPDRAMELSDLIADPPTARKGLSVFKSVGTALQDIAVAVPLLRRVEESGGGQDIGDFPANKPFT